MSLSDPIVTVECDSCGGTDELHLTCTARGWDDRDIDKDLKRLGYTSTSEYEHICRDCRANADEESK